MSHESTSIWHYHKVFLGSSTNKVDSVILKIAEHLRFLKPVSNWFYLRYVDDNEFHLRMRVHLAPSISGIVLEDIYSAVLANVDDLEVDTYCPMIHLPNSGPLRFNLTKAPRAELHVYEPEYGLYGGVSGMPIAESFFTTSSQIACLILQAERLGKCSRKTLAPLLMRDFYAAVTFDTRWSEFWRRYSLYWLGGNTPYAETMRNKFLAKLAELDQDRIPFFIALTELDESVKSALLLWRSSIASFVATSERKKVFTRVPKDLLLSQLMHLMMNRLGLNILEEAYMATLCESALPRQYAISL